MNKKSVIARIKAMFAEEVEQTFIDVKTQDGRILRASDIVIDGTILEVTEEGEIPLEDNEYVLEEGYTLVVESGVIKEIKEPVVEESVTEEPVAEEMEEETTVKATIKKRFSGIVRYLIEDNSEAEAEAVQTESEVTIVANEIKPEEPVVIIDENLQVVEDWTGTMDVMVEDQTQTVTIENGVITEVSGVTEEVMEEEPEQVIERTEEVSLEDFNSELVIALESIKNELQILKEENKKLSERFNKFASEPSEEPIVTKVDFNKVDKNERLKFFGQK